MREKDITQTQPSMQSENPRFYTLDRINIVKSFIIYGAAESVFYKRD